LHDKRSSVYAYSGELQRWLDFRRAHEGAAASAPDQWALEEGNDAVGEYPTQIKSLPDVSAAPLPAPTTPWPARRILIGFSIGLVVAGLVLLLRWRPFLQPAKNQTVATLVRTVPLATLPGEIEGLALSPDGRQIAFTWNGPNVARWNLYVQRIGGESPLQITHTDGGMITGVDWSPDGRLLSFGRCGEGNRGALYTISPLGGEEHRLTDVACDWGEAKAIWTPDGQSLVFSDACVPGESLGIAVFTLTSGLKRCVAVADSNTVDLLNPAVSPDGSTVAFIRMSTVRVSDIFIVPLKGGTLRQLTFEGRNAWDPRWTNDGKAIIFASDRGGVIGDNRWRIPAAGGPIEPANNEILPSSSGRLFATASRDGRRVAYVDYRADKFVIWRARLSNGKLLSQERLFESPKRMEGPQLSPDLKHMAFESFLSGASNIWKSDADGHDGLQLTSFGGESVNSSRWSPDGKWIVFARRPADHAQVYLIDSEGKNMHAITEGAYENEMPTWSRDGRTIYFTSNRTGTMQLWRQDLESSVAVQITQHGGYVASESYDRRYLYFAKFFSPGIWRIPIGGGEEEKVMDRPEAWYSGIGTFQRLACIITMSAPCLAPRSSFTISEPTIQRRSSRQMGRQGSGTWA
jgi:Tol biopolymer transport system component